MSETATPPATTETVQSFHQALAERVTTGAGLSWRQLADQVGRADSTIRGWLTNTKPISPKNLATLLQRVGADDAEVSDWQRRRAAITGPASQGTQAGAVSGPERRTGGRSAGTWRWLERLGLVVVGIVVGIVGTLLLAHPNADTGNAGGAAPSEQGRVGNCGPVQLDLRSGSVATRISHTGRLGVWQYRGPGRAFCREQDGLPEGTQVRVVCQNLTGEVREDRREDGELVGSTVWDKLDSGMWIPHLYTDLPMTDGSTLVAGLDRC